MSLLRVYPENDPVHFYETTDIDRIAAGLGSAGVRFEHWGAAQNLRSDASQEEVLQVYQEPLSRIMKEIGFVTADVISVNSQMPNHPDLRKKFLDEHTHDEDEARFFVEGRGLFYIHVQSKVFCILCARGDFIDIPAGTRHWFDMGPSPLLKCVRTFNTPEGWVANFTNSGMAARFPRYEAIVLATEEV